MRKPKCGICDELVNQVIITALGIPIKDLVNGRRCWLLRVHLLHGGVVAPIGMRSLHFTSIVKGSAFRHFHGCLNAAFLQKFVRILRFNHLNQIVSAIRRRYRRSFFARSHGLLALFRLKMALGCLVWNKFTVEEMMIRPPVIPGGPFVLFGLLLIIHTSFYAAVASSWSNPVLLGLIERLWYPRPWRLLIITLIKEERLRWFLIQVIVQLFHALGKHRWQRPATQR